jgi:peptidoglycan-N-acetylglucosamine deacetylase
MIEISFSWDDGAVEDLKLAELSKKYEIPGIFFIPESNPERAVMNPVSIQELYREGFLIGAHTRSHVYLTKINPNLIENELLQGKIFLEKLLNTQIDNFCLPGGYYNSYIISECLKLFKTVRTADTCYASKDYPIIKPTFHFYNRGLKSLMINSLRGDRRLLKYLLTSKYHFQYFELLKDLLTKMDVSEDYFKVMIWGHSWEIERFELWEKLEDLFTFVHHNFKDKVTPYNLFTQI